MIENKNMDKSEKGIKQNYIMKGKGNKILNLVFFSH